MRKFIFLILTFSFLDMASQETATDTTDYLGAARLKPFEIAYTFFGVNFKNEIEHSSSKGPTFEFLNGILFRYKFNRISLRLNASVSEKKSEKENTYNCTSCFSGRAELLNYKVGIGGQFTPLKKKEFIYSYLDLSYKRRRENGSKVDGRDTSAILINYQGKTNGLDIVLGVGTKIRIYRSLYFSGELGYNYYIAENRTKNTDAKTQQTFYQSAPVTFQTLLGKLYLSLIF